MLKRYFAVGPGAVELAERFNTDDEDALTRLLARARLLGSRETHPNTLRGVDSFDGQCFPPVVFGSVRDAVLARHPMDRARKMVRAARSDVMPKRYFAMPKPTLQPARMNDRTHRIKKTDGAALPAGILPPFRPAQLRRLCKAQFALPTVPGRLIGRSSRSVRAALHDAEMADWQASGGDYLNSHLATVFVRV